MTIPMVNEFIYLTRIPVGPINQRSSVHPRPHRAVDTGVIISQSKSIDLPKRLRFRAVYHRALMNLFYVDRIYRVTRVFVARAHTRKRWATMKP